MLFLRQCSDDYDDGGERVSAGQARVGLKKAAKLGSGVSQVAGAAGRMTWSATGHSLVCFTVTPGRCSVPLDRCKSHRRSCRRRLARLNHSLASPCAPPRDGPLQQACGRFLSPRLAASPLPSTRVWTASTPNSSRAGPPAHRCAVLLPLFTAGVHNPQLHPL